MGMLSQGQEIKFEGSFHVAHAVKVSYICRTQLVFHVEKINSKNAWKWKIMDNIHGLVRWMIDMAQHLLVVCTAQWYMSNKSFTNYVRHPIVPQAPMMQMVPIPLKNSWHFCCHQDHVHDKIGRPCHSEGVAATSSQRLSGTRNTRGMTTMYVLLTMKLLPCTYIHALKLQTVSTRSLVSTSTLRLCNWLHDMCHVIVIQKQQSDC